MRFNSPGQLVWKLYRRARWDVVQFYRRNTTYCIVMGVFIILVCIYGTHRVWVYSHVRKEPIRKDLIMEEMYKPAPVPVAPDEPIHAHTTTGRGNP